MSLVQEVVDWINARMSSSSLAEEASLVVIAYSCYALDIISGCAC